MLNKIRRYIEVSRILAREYEKLHVVVLIRALLANIFYGQGIKYFSYYSLITRPYSEYGEFMRKDELEEIQGKLNSLSGKECADSKFLFYRRCVELNLSTPTIYGRITESPTSDLDTEVPALRSGDQLAELLSLREERSYIIKPDRGYHGKGLMRLTFENGSLIYRKNGLLVHESPMEFIESLPLKENDFLLQEQLVPNVESLPIMANGGIGTVRIVTVRYDGGAKLLLACLRIPIADNVNDNFASGQTGNLLADIDLESGVLGNCFAPDSEERLILRPVDRHPETHLKIKGFQFPCWDEIISLSLKAASKFEDLYTCGWDIALSEDGPKLIETNWRYDIDIMQIASQSPLRSTLITGLAQK